MGEKPSSLVAHGSHGIAQRMRERGKEIDMIWDLESSSLKPNLLYFCVWLRKNKMHGNMRIEKLNFQFKSNLYF